jgi:RNA polymerase sigma-70 factor (ECF subfamily)
MTGLQDAFVKKIKENEALIFKVCRVYAPDEEDGKDLFQDIVVQLWQYYPSYRGDSKFSTWLYRVALNTAITRVRKKERSVLPGNQSAELNENLHYESSSLEEQEQLKSLYRAINILGEIDKALVMLYLEDYSYTEMEEILGIKESTLRVKMNRVKEKLKTLTKSY